MKKLHREYLALLRAGLWGGNPAFSGRVPYRAVMDLAAKQGTLLFVCKDHLSALEENIGMIERNIVLIRGVSKICDKEGIEFYLLKGEGNGILYPAPELRSCGDVDIYVRPEQFERAYAALRGHANRESRSTSRHIQFSFEHNGHTCTLELHHHLPHPPMPRRMLKAYEAWTAQVLDTAPKCQVTLHRRLEDGTALDFNVQVLPFSLNLVTNFAHIADHFLGKGIGMKQLCDLAVLLSTACPDQGHSNGGTPDGFRDDLSRLGILRKWQVVSGAAADRLGIPTECVPCYDSGFVRRLRSYALIRGILASGVPDWSKRANNIMLRKVQTALFMAKMAVWRLIAMGL